MNNNTEINKKEDKKEENKSFFRFKNKILWVY